MQNRGTLTTRAAFGAACLLLLAATGAVAQKSEKSTAAGVYTLEQATRGADVFAGMCKSCHATDQHTGPTFMKAWGDRPLAELFVYLATKMPKNDPGSLPPEEYSQVLAYLLKLNGMPAGPTELPTDSLLMKNIRFEATEKVRKSQ
jgi:mono/diheme cytochrome c family protein